jgi:hypothetical protein
MMVELSNELENIEKKARHPQIVLTNCAVKKVVEGCKDRKWEVVHGVDVEANKEEE